MKGRMVIKLQKNNDLLVRAEQQPNHHPYDSAEPLGDLRFRALLGAAAWASLPVAVRRRFSKRLANAETATYVGRITETRMSICGWLLSQCARLIGGPLPLSRDEDVPAIVTVTEDEETGGQFWTRVYGHHVGFPQVIHSSKRFAGSTGLEEYVGRGVGMALTVDVEDGALIFRSAGYFLQFFGRRIPLPRWINGFRLTVSHVERGQGQFDFVLDLRHARLGELIHQTAQFGDVHAE